METLKTVVGWVLMLIAVATAIQIVAQSTYDAQLTVWFWLDIAIAFALAVALISSYMRKSEVDNAGNGVSREFLAANTLFYSSIFVGVLFLWNWLIFLMDGEDAGGIAYEIVWAFSDAASVLLAGITGRHLVNSTSGD